jgi:hypothetical protein
VLRQTHTLADELVENRGFRGAVVEAAEIAVTHVVGHDEHNVGSIVHRA